MIELILALVGLILSAFFSGSEIAFVQANPVQIEIWQKQGRRAAGKTSQYLADPERFLTTLLVGTNFANVLTSSYATVALLRFGVSQIWTILIISFVILMFGEIIPKVFFRDHANTMAVGVTPLLSSAEAVLSPFVKLVKSYSRILSRGETHPPRSLLTREDLRVLFDEVEVSRELEEDEKEVISNIFEFGSRPVRVAMTPRPDIVAIPVDASAEDMIQVLSETGLSKLPVYDQDLDNIVGLVFLHDLFSRPDAVKSILKRPLLIPDTMLASDALQKLKRQRSSVAIVVGENNKTVGLVTVEDLIEELFGEFEDVFDSEGRQITRLPDGSFILDSLVEIDELRKRYFYDVPEGNYETIGGLVLSKLGRIPRAGEMLDFGTFRIKILLATPSRLKRLHLAKRP